jgi:hypothetical protein
LQISANADSAGFVESPEQYLITVLVTSFAVHTLLTSDGSGYVLIAPRRQAGGAATVKDARARKVAAKRDWASMLTVVGISRSFVDGWMGVVGDKDESAGVNESQMSKE